jgi:septal ring factor EnvC (AmiA/AmiB activator)
MGRDGVRGGFGGAARRGGLAACALLAASLVLAQTARQRDAELAAVRKNIKALETRLSSQMTQRDDTQRALREAELAAAEGAHKLAEVRARLRAQQAEQQELAGRTQRTTARLAAERAALAGQVRSSYMNGREELLKVLLSPASPAALGRMLVYYDYFNRARSERIGAVRAEVDTLHDLGAESERAAAELGALEQQQEAEAAALEHARDTRRGLVAKLDAGIADSRSEIGKLRADEKRIADLIAEIKQLSADFPVDSEQPFARLKGKLAWPVQGRIAGDYGQPRSGGPVKWTGVLLEASQGSPVRAVYRGRVAFADWLPGLGLLLIVDHGGGYLSLYAHNEALLKEAGDWVEPGEAIARVGDTGGQARPALYFEIRENGEPVNPHAWIGSPAKAR